MKHLFRLSIVLLSVVLLNACSGGPGGKDNNGGNDDATESDDTHILKKTGQTKSYDENGVEMTDNSIKDDGYYQKGITPNYARDNTKDIVTDTITGLQWQDNNDTTNITKPWLTQENYDKCTGSNGQMQDTSKCTDTSGDTATTYCANLSLGGYSDWRLPTIDELMYIADRNPAIDPTFQNTRLGSYWSSTSIVGNEGLAWYVRFYFGDGDGWGDKSYSDYVRCVRGKEANIENRYTRSGGIVTDNKTGLQWQDDYSDNGDSIKSDKWTDAIAYCESLSLGGHDDWRLPNFNELYYIADRSRRIPAIDPTFQNAPSDYYWSSTSIVGNEDNAWGVYFSYGFDFWFDKSVSGYVRCVRAGE